MAARLWGGGGGHRSSYKAVTAGQSRMEKRQKPTEMWFDSGNIKDANPNLQ